MRKSVRLCSLLYPLYLGQLPPGAKCTKMISLFGFDPTPLQQKWKAIRAQREPLQASDDPNDFS